MNKNNSMKNLKFPKARDEVENLNVYSAPLEGRRDFLRLDFNENTIGPSPVVIESLKNIKSESISIYPEYNGLKEAIIKNLISTADLKSCNTSHIGIFNGVDAALNSIFHAFGNRGDLFLTTNPTFGYYGPCADMQGMKKETIFYEGESFKFPFSKIKRILENQKTKILLLCNPNNPTGTRIDAELILEMAKISPETLVVIDELYEAFTGDSVVPLIDLQECQNIIILRSLSKTAGLAGLRIGFAIGHKDLIKKICRVTGPYDVNSFAVTAAFAALGDQLYIDNYVKEVLKAKDWIKKELISHKIKHHIEGGNYFLMWPKNTPEFVEESLRNKGILVRNMRGKALIDGSLRVSIGTKSQMRKFLDAIIN